MPCCSPRVQVGIPVDHHLLHLVEGGGLAVAAVGTLAATLGELLAVRKLVQQERVAQRARIDAAAAAAAQALDDAALRPPGDGPAAAAGAAREQQQQPPQEPQAEAPSPDAASARAADAGWRWDDGGGSSAGTEGKQP